jgi:predicted Zn-dependent protease
VPPANGQDGKLKLAHLQGTFKLVGDQMMEDRVARVGASVVPAWQKAMPNTNPRKIDYQFYVVEKTSVNDCYSIPNGTVLVPKKILTALPEDSDLAAVVAGCVAEVTVDQALHFYSRLTTASALSVGAVAVGVLIPGVGLAALAGGGYNEHEISLAEEQAARIAMTYLQMSGYPATAGATAWEKLEGKHDQMQPGQQPGRRARLEYEAQGEVGAPLSPSAGDVPPNAVPSSH